MLIRPMLAVDIDKISRPLKFPFLASPKLDGVRMLVKSGVAYTRSGKLLPNKIIQKWVSRLPDIGGDIIDGEIIVGDPTDPDVFRKSVSFAMTENPAELPVWDYWAFDVVNEEQIARRTPALARNIRLQLYKELFVLVPQTIIYTQAELQQAYDLACAQRYEGIMLKQIHAPYKEGRSTSEEQFLIKKKLMKEIEVIVVQAHPLFVNDNPQELDELGYSKRSSHLENMVEQEMLGSLEVTSPLFPKTFKVGTGFTESERILLWKIRDDLPGRVVTIRYQDYGIKDVPRQPSFKGFREGY